MTELPAPLVEPETNLRDFAFMPLEVERLRRSKAWLLSKRNPEIGFYMLNLWMASWHELPAGSLEDDNEVLADAAMCSQKRWTKVRPIVMRAWVKCSDGRLYHPVVCEKARDAWSARKIRVKRGTAGARARWGFPDAPSIVQASPSNAQAMLSDGKGEGYRRGKGQGEGKGDHKDSDTTVSDAREPRRTHTADFERWWSRYPHKVGKGAARKAYERALTKTSADQLDIGVERYKASKPDRIEWCNPATWLNQERWSDVPTATIKLNGAGAGAALPLLDDMRRPSGPPPESL